jgi:hypothetical protein
VQSPPCASDGASPSVNPIEIGARRPEKAERPWRLVAGTLSDTEMRLATISVDGDSGADRPAEPRTLAWRQHHLGPRARRRSGNRQVGPNAESDGPVPRSNMAEGLAF